MEPELLMRFLHYTMTLLFFLSMITYVGSISSQCGRFDLEYQMFSSENTVLKNHVHKQKTVANHVICGRDCSMDEDCKSFNFYECKKLCELNNATRAEHPQDFLEDQGSVYFDADENTPIYSVADNSLTLFNSCRELLDAGHLTSDPTTPFFSTQSPLPKLSSCKAFLDAGYTDSKVYTIYPDGIPQGLRVYCDMETDGGGWIVFQRRIDGTVDFYRNWTEYQTGFGDPSGEFWLGNDNLVKLTSAGYTNLRVDLESDGKTGYVEYSEVSVTDNEYEFSYSNKIGGNAYDSLSDNKGYKFTTKDRESENCADTTHGAWWFRDCTVKSHLNGEYGPNLGGKRGIIWYEWTQPITSCSMKLRQP